ncbi:MAG: hypothetical protein Q8S13_12120, partial [Dehalococcoidia bacterium]|nr:hypothetical protein [Dehalococcoidia bacterium]
TLVEALNVPIPVAPDPKNPSQNQQLGSFEFQLTYNQQKVCVDIDPGMAAAGMTCIVEDSTNSQLEGVARIGCVTLGKFTFPDTNTPAGRHLATILVRPQPDEYSIIKPNQDNGNVVHIGNSGCELADLQGHPIKVASCDDADVTMRFLEGDVEADCTVDTLDTQATAFRWGAEKGDLLYNERFNLEPSAAQADQDVDINDVQFIYGRFGSTCGAPHPPQNPVNPNL